MIIRRMFSTGDGGGVKPGIIYVPDDYNASNKYPLLVFSHGAGESGDGTLAQVDKVLANGSPISVANNGNPMAFVNPFDGKTYKFIILALQGIRGWCCQADETVYCIQNDIQKNYNINPNAIFKTGLSAGGETTWEALGGPNSTLFAGGVPMSTPSINTNIASIPLIGTNNIRVWAFHGSLDGGLTDYWNSWRYCQQIEAVSPGDSHLTSYNGGHCCWGTYYDPGYKETFTVNGKTASYNMYEIMLASTKGQSFSFLAPTTSTTTTTTTTIKPLPTTSTTTTTTTTKKMAALAAVLAASTSGSTVTLTGFNSTGSIGSWYITITGRPPGAPNPWFDNGRGDGGPGLASTIIKGLTNVVDGTWTFILTIQAPSGEFATSAPVSVTVAASTKPVITTTYQHVMADGKTLTIFSDFSYTIV